jgi:DNA modification methylase
VPQTILDPFSGAGTTGLVAARFDRNYIGIELNPEYAEMSRKRIADRVGVMEPEHLDEDQHAQGRMF